MTCNQDARPFIDLLKDAEEFKAKFDDDIKKCIGFLDEKITALIRDPDSLGNPRRGINSNPVVEFSKAKYEIFIGAKSIMNDMEREWLKYIAEMKKLFIENVEIFLAGTKLEVKLPTNEFQSSPGFKKSPRKQDRSSITSSIYPLINSFAKNVTALGSPLRVKDSIAQKRFSKRASNDFQLSNSDETSEDESVKTGHKSSHFSVSMKPTVRITKDDESAAKASQRKSFVSLAETDTDESESDRKTPSSRSRGTKEKSSTSDLDTSISKSRSRRSNETKVNTSELDDLLLHSKQRSMLVTETTVINSPGLNRSRSSSGARSISRNELKNLSDSPGFNRSRSSSGHRSKLNNSGFNKSRSSSGHRSKLNNSDLDISTNSSSKSHSLSNELKNLSNSPGFEASRSNSVSTGRQSSGRKSSSSAETPKKTAEINEVQADEDSSDSDREERGRRQQKRSLKSRKQKDVSAELTRETKDREETEIGGDISIASRTGRGRKGRQLAKNTKLMDTSVEQQEKDEEANEAKIENKPSNSKRAGRPRKGKKSVKISKEENASETPHLSPNKVIGKATRNQSESAGTPKNSTSGESEEINKDEQINDVNEAQPKKAMRRASTKETRLPSRTLVRSNRRAIIDDTSEESIHSSPKRARHSTKQEANSAAKPKAVSTEESEISGAEENKASTRGKRGKQAAEDKFSDTSVISKTPGRASRRAAVKDIPQTEQSPKKSNLIRSNESVVSGVTRSPKKVTFTKVVEEDLDIYTPAKVSKPAIRRKTLMPNLDEISDIVPGNSTRAKGKRKTIGGVSNLTAIIPPKRLRVSESKKSAFSSQDEEDTDDNPLESDGDYTHWIPLKSVDAKIPAHPAIYEVKVSRAKKSAYIGCCDSLRQKLTLYKLRQNSGHKHLDKFIDRNINDIQIRYEVVSSVNDAKTEVKNRINSFVAQHKTTPAYN